MMGGNFDGSKTGVGYDTLRFYPSGHDVHKNVLGKVHGRGLVCDKKGHYRAGERGLA